MKPSLAQSLTEKMSKLQLRPVFEAENPDSTVVLNNWGWDVLLVPSNHADGDNESDAGYAQAATPLSPSTPSIASTPRFLWAGEELGLGMQTAFYKVSGPRRKEIDTLLNLLEDARTERHEQKVGELLLLNEFWERLEKLEGSFLEEEDADAMDVDIVRMIQDLHKELRMEHASLDRMLENVRCVVV
jgi:hypothetical protein